VEKVLVELFTVDFDQQNQIWGSLSTGLIPSVIYKVRMIVFDRETAGREFIPIKEIKAAF